MGTVVVADFKNGSYLHRAAISVVTHIKAGEPNCIVAYLCCFPLSQYHLVSITNGLLGLRRKIEVVKQVFSDVRLSH